MLYRFAWVLCRTVLLTIRRMKVRGTENVPMHGGLVVVSNHKSYWDPVIMGCVLPRERQVRYMAKAELFKIPGLALIIKKLGTFPVNRGGSDRSAIRRALEILASGEIVGIFPEGTRSKSDDMLEPHLGAAMLVARAGVPVLPVAIIGSRGFFGKVSVIIGKPIVFNRESSDGVARKADRKEYSEMSIKIMDSISGLIKAGS